MVKLLDGVFLPFEGHEFLAKEPMEHSWYGREVDAHLRGCFHSSDRGAKVHGGRARPKWQRQHRCPWLVAYSRVPHDFHSEGLVVPRLVGPRNEWVNFVHALEPDGSKQPWRTNQSIGCDGAPSCRPWLDRRTWNGEARLLQIDPSFVGKEEKV